MNTRIILSFVSAVAVFCAAPNSIDALQRLAFAGSPAYAAEADAPAAASSAQPESAGSGSASATASQSAKKVPSWMNPATVFRHPIIIHWRGRHIKVPHDSDECAQALLYAAAGKAVPVQDKECRAVMAHILKIYRTEPIPPPPPPKPHGDVPICEMTLRGHYLRAPHNGRECCLAVSEALYKNATVPAPNDECRVLMLKALEIERNAPPLEVKPYIQLPEQPPQFASPEESVPLSDEEAAPEEPAAENVAPNPEDLAPPTGPLPSLPTYGHRMPIIPH